MDDQVIVKKLEKIEHRLDRIEEYLSNFQAFQSADEPDELYEQAEALVRQYDKASASLLQRRLAIGYARAARLLDQLTQRGVVENGDGMKPRRVLAK